MSEKRLLEIFKSIILLFVTSTCFGPPIVSKIGNLNINDYFYTPKNFMSPPNIEVESLQKHERTLSKKVYVPSIIIINKLMEMDKKKIELKSLSDKSEKNSNKENSILVRDRNKKLPKKVDKIELTPPSGLTIQGGTNQGGSIN